MVGNREWFGRQQDDEEEGKDHRFREPDQQRARCIRGLSQHQIGFVGANSLDERGQECQGMALVIDQSWCGAHMDEERVGCGLGRCSLDRCANRLISSCDSSLDCANFRVWMWV